MKYILVLITTAMFMQGTFAKCPDLYPNGKTLEVSGTVELCNSWYVVRYDQKNDRAVFASEKLKRVRADTPRESHFKSDKRVKNPISTGMYSNAGYDRGHLAPAEDSPDETGMEESFLMTNVVPQDAKLNRIKWRMLESSIRKRANSDIIVITGAIYQKDGKVLSKRVSIPSHMYKVVYYPWGVERFIAENTPKSSVSKITDIELERLTGISFPK